MGPLSAPSHLLYFTTTGGSARLELFPPAPWSACQLWGSSLDRGPVDSIPSPLMLCAAIGLLRMTLKVVFP
jgi:hypothetical protein